MSQISESWNRWRDRAMVRNEERWVRSMRKRQARLARNAHGKWIVPDPWQSRLRDRLGGLVCLAVGHDRPLSYKGHPKACNRCSR